MQSDLALFLPKKAKELARNITFCDARLWVVVTGETCPICGAPPMGSLCLGKKGATNYKAQTVYQPAQKK